MLSTSRRLTSGSSRPVGRRTHSVRRCARRWVKIMKHHIVLLVVVMSSSLSYAEQMPWETDEYKAREFEATSSYLAGIRVEELLLVGTISNPGVPARALIQIRGAKVLPVQAGMKIGLNQGVVKEISEDSLTIEERLPVCEKVGFYSRTTVMSVNKALPAGTTVVFTVNDGRNECQ